MLDLLLEQIKRGEIDALDHRAINPQLEVAFPQVLGLAARIAQQPDEKTANLVKENNLSGKEGSSSLLLTSLGAALQRDRPLGDFCRTCLPKGLVGYCSPYPWVGGVPKGPVPLLITSETLLCFQQTPNCGYKELLKEHSERKIRQTLIRGIWARLDYRAGEYNQLVPGSPTSYPEERLKQSQASFPSYIEGYLASKRNDVKAFDRSPFRIQNKDGKDAILNFFDSLFDQKTLDQIAGNGNKAGQIKAWDLAN